MNVKSSTDREPPRRQPSMPYPLPLPQRGRPAYLLEDRGSEEIGARRRAREMAVVGVL